jgi:RND family efflux transporter MFP subunit
MDMPSQIKIIATHFRPLHAVAAVTSLVLCASALTGCERAEGVAPAPVPTVTVVRSVQGEVVNWDGFTGRFEAVDRVELRPRVSGYIDHVSVSEGQLVRKDDLLFQIDPRAYRAEMDRAVAEVARGRSQRELARSELARAERLLQARAVSHEEYERRVSEANQAEANLNAALAAQQTAQLNLGFTRVCAPIGGRVSRAEVTAGNYVTAGQTALTSIVSVNPIYVYFDADERSYLRYSEGARGAGSHVGVGLADENGFPHSGRLDFFDNALNSQAGTMRARIVLENPAGRFSPGLFARIRLSADGARPAVLVDDRAVNTDQNRRFVLIVDTSKHVVYREIDPGELAENGLRIVRSGLAAGETVIVAGAMGVGPGAIVDAKTESPPSLASAATGAAR